MEPAREDFETYEEFVPRVKAVPNRLHSNTVWMSAGSILQGRFVFSSVTSPMRKR